jgi:hypothetical protein
VRDGVAEGGHEVPAELPPEVIAAEAELIDAGATLVHGNESPPPAESAEPESIGSELSFLDVGEPASNPPAASAPIRPRRARRSRSPSRSSSISDLS